MLNLRARKAPHLAENGAVRGAHHGHAGIVAAALDAQHEDSLRSHCTPTEPCSNCQYKLAQPKAPFVAFLDTFPAAHCLRTLHPLRCSQHSPAILRETHVRLPVAQLLPQSLLKHCWYRNRRFRPTPLPRSRCRPCMLVAPCALAPSCLIITLFSKQEILLPASLRASGVVGSCLTPTSSLQCLRFEVSEPTEHGEFTKLCSSPSAPRERRSREVTLAHKP